jgi:hypothetical protein
MDQSKVILSLTRSEAIVFVEFLTRYRDRDRLVIEHEAESCLLYDFCALIENQLPELFDPAWKSIVGRSREEFEAGPD